MNSLSYKRQIYGILKLSNHKLVLLRQKEVNKPVVVSLNLTVLDVLRILPAFP